MTVLKRLLQGLIILVLILVAVGFFLPSSVKVERSVTIDAPRSVVFRLVNSFQRFNEWSPWAEMDPEGTTYTFSGPDSGVGATMEWESEDPNVGSGMQEIIASEPHQRVDIYLDFGASGQATSYYRLHPAPEGTRVTWGFSTDFGYDLFERYLGLFFDDWVGGDYEAGLRNLKALAESLPAARAPSVDIDVVDVEPQALVWISGETTTDDGSITRTLDQGFERLGIYIEVNGLEQDGVPRAVTHEWDEEGGRWVHDVALPVAELPDPIPQDGEVRAGMAYSGPAVRAIHEGPPAEIGPVYDVLMAYIERNGLTVAGSSWEEYMTDPAETPPAEMVTHIYFPVE